MYKIYLYILHDEEYEGCNLYIKCKIIAYKDVNDFLSQHQQSAYPTKISVSNVSGSLTTTTGDQCKILMSYKYNYM